MHTKVITPDVIEGAFHAWPPACVPSCSTKLSVGVFCTGKNMVVKTAHFSFKVVL